MVKTVVLDIRSDWKGMYITKVNLNIQQLNTLYIFTTFSSRQVVTKNNQEA